MIFLLNPKRKSEDKWTVQFMCVSVCIFLSENISSFVCLLYIHLHVCVFDRMAWTTRQLWTWSLHVSLGEACADLGWKTISLAGLLLIVNLYTFLFTCSGGLSTGPAWDCQCDKQESDAELPRKFTKAYWRSNMTYHYTNSLAQNLGPALRETCAMQVLHYPEALNKPAQNQSFKRRVLERPPFFCIWIITPW